MTPQELADLNLTWPLEVSEEFKAALLAKATLHKGSLVIGGESGHSAENGITFVVDGLVAIYTAGSLEKRVFMGLARKGKWYGALRTVIDVNNPVYAENIIEPTLLQVPVTHVNSLKDTYPETYKFLYGVSTHIQHYFLQTLLLQTITFQKKWFIPS